MQHAMRTTLAILGAVVAIAAPVQAQNAPGVVTSWTPFFGCWSTSSEGSIGPMVCVVPGQTRDQVEFVRVRDDSIVSRTVVDASGKRVAALRPGCTGWEQGTWASDGQRLLMRAEYKCGRGRVQRSDAILSLSHSDAFTHVERNVRDGAAAPRVVNFIVQLDTTVFPTEVRRLLPHLRPLAVETSELEVLPPIPPAMIVEVASALDAGVVQAWLADRGELTPELLTTVRLVSAAANGDDLPSASTRLPRSGVRNNLGRFGTVALYSPTLPNYLTADHGIRVPLNFGQPDYWHLDGMGPQTQLGVPFRWP